MITVKRMIHKPIFWIPNAPFKKLNSTFMIHPRILATSPIINVLFWVNKIPAKINLLMLWAFCPQLRFARRFFPPVREPDHILLLRTDCTLQSSMLPEVRLLSRHIFQRLPVRTRNSLDNKGILCFLTVIHISDIL